MHCVYIRCPKEAAFPQFACSFEIFLKDLFLHRIHGLGAQLHLRSGPSPGNLGREQGTIPPQGMRFGKRTCRVRITKCPMCEKLANTSQGERSPGAQTFGLDRGKSQLVIDQEDLRRAKGPEGSVCLEVKEPSGPRSRGPGPAFPIARGQGRSTLQQG